MAQTPDGGPAFPKPTHATSNYANMPTWTIHAGGGMSLRDWFAGQAIVGMLSNVEVMRLGKPLGDEPVPDWIATEAYGFADALLRARAAQSPADTMRAHLDEFGK